jgi:hypothetical protein
VLNLIKTKALEELGIVLETEVIILWFIKNYNYKNWPFILKKYVI